MSYEQLQAIAASWGFAIAAAVFLGVIFWVMRPSRKTFYEEAGKSPLRED